MAMYMKIEGIEGECTQKGHEKWFDIQTMSIGFQNMGGGMPSSSGGRVGGEPVCGEMSISMPGCSALPTITKYLLTGTTVKSIEIQSVTTTNNQEVIYSSWSFKDCAFSSIALSDSGEGASRMSVSLSISYTKKVFKVTPISDDGKAGSAVELKYNVAKKAAE